jgi:hypothetical protein
MVPAVLSLSAFGPAGLVVAGFLFAMTGPLKDGILEFLGPPARIAGSSKGSGKPLDPFFLSAYKNRFPITSLSISFSRHPVSFAPLVSMAALVIVSASGILPWLVTIISFVCSIVFMLIEALVESSKALESGHRPFIPLMIIPSRRMFPLGTSRTIAPFVMASLICLISEVFLLLAFPSFGRPAGALVEGPSMNDYEEHLVFQRSFSLRRLGGNGVDSAYLNYELSEIGLVIQSDGKVGLDGIPKPNPYPSELPPVERIMKRVNHHPSTDSPFSAIGGFLSYPSILVVVLSVIVTAPMFLGKGSKKRRSKNASFLAAKRMAA